MKSIACEISELQGMDVPALVTRYEELFGKPPRSKHRVHLWRRCAWKVQEQRLGGLSETAKNKLNELMGQIDLPLETGPTVTGRVTRPGEPPVGTVLTRVYHGEEVQATRTEAGWEVDGVVYRSLSGAAKAITGSHWNGRLFFGLTRRKR